MVNLNKSYEIKGNSTTIIELRQRIDQLAQYKDTAILVVGERGTGKELVARRLHWNSPRKNKVFYPMNCGSMPPELIESNLFGHHRGSFTGAYESKRGAFETADGGTIFFDEIANMSVDAQQKLLRVVEYGTYIPIGSNRELASDVRIIAATNTYLYNNPKFRQDLFDRFDTSTVVVPPLRERKEDIPDLLQFYLEKLNEAYGKDRTIDKKTIAVFQSYDFPGNVRQLRNVLEDAYVSSTQDTIDREYVAKRLDEERKKTSDSMAQHSSQNGHFSMSLPYPTTLDDGYLEFLRAIINRALSTNKTMAEAARELGTSSTTLHRHIRMLGYGGLEEFKAAHIKE